MAKKGQKERQHVEKYQHTSRGSQGLVSSQNARSPVLGILSFVLVVVCGIVFCVDMLRLGDLAGKQMAEGNVDASGQLALQKAVFKGVSTVWLVVFYGSGAFGFVGWIMGIVATVTRRGRSLGIVAITLGIIIPIAALGVMLDACVSYVP